MANSQHDGIMIRSNGLGFSSAFSISTPSFLYSHEFSSLLSNRKYVVQVKATDILLVSVLLYIKVQAKQNKTTNALPSIFSVCMRTSN